MKKELIQQVISHLENEGVLSEAVPVTEDEFLEKLYVNSSDRREILKGLISLFSEDYKSDLNRSVSVDNDLARKMHELEFVTKEKQLHFVMGKCTKEEQQAIYEKIFKSLHLIFIAQDHDCNKLPSSSLTEKLPKKGIQLSDKKLKKLTKNKFNLEQANTNLDHARKTLAAASELIVWETIVAEKTLQHKLEFKEVDESKLSELSSTAESFSLTMERRIPLSSAEGTTESQIVPGEVGSAVGELYSILQFVADTTKSSSSEGIELKKKFDLAKMLVQASELDNNSVVSRCFSRDINCNNGDTSADE